MNRRWPALIAILALTLVVAAPSCREKGPPEGRADRVVMVSYDGLGADLAWQWINGGVASEPDGLAGLANHGFSVRRTRVVSPTLTAVNHWSLITGASPARTGIVSNRFHVHGTPMSRMVSGFSHSSEAPALWNAAIRNGLTVATMLWPGADAGALDRMGDFGVTWPMGPVAWSEIHELDPATAGTTGELMSKDGVTPLTWPLEIRLPGADPGSLSLEVAAYDGTPDETPRYDTVAARLADDISWRLAGDREWFVLEAEILGPDDLRPWTYGLWSKPLYLDRFTGALRLYRGAVWRLYGYPDAFTAELVEAIGPWPGLPDERYLAQWWLDMATGIDLDTFLEQIERLDRYLDRMAGWVLDSKEFQLMLHYHPTPDEYQHAALIVHPDQWGYTPGTALAAREGLKRMGRSVDASIATLWGALDGERDALVVVSDHGLVPITDEVRVSRVLEEAGLLTVAERDGRRSIAEDSPMTVAASGASTHVYLNLEGREPGGVVKRSEAGELLARAAKAFADLEQDGRPVVERIFKRSEAAEIGLDHPNSGDLIVFFRPGFTTSWRPEGELIEPSRYYGQHGYLGHHNAMSGIFFARGVDIEVGSREELEVTDIAPLVASWLGFDLN
jgi:predicted AlkP superfamily phosphohydrolase/phosphomutase